MTASPVRPSPPSPGPAARSPRRLSPLDAAFLYYERPNQLLYVGCVALLDGPLAYKQLLEALDRRLAARYRQRPVRPLLDLGWPRWENDPDYEIRRHVRHVAVPAPGGDGELRELVDTLFATPFDPGRPPWEIYLIDGVAGDRGALLWKVHHCMIDGVSGAQLLQATADGAEARSPGVRRAEPPGVAAWVSDAVAAIRLAATPRFVRERATEVVAAASLIGSFFRDAVPELPFNGPLSDRRRIVWAAFALDEFLTLRGAAGCKVNDVVLAVITGALRRYVSRRGTVAGLRGARALVPVSVRAPEDHLTLGNLVSAMYPMLPLEIDDPVERLRRIASEMQSLKEGGQARAAGMVMGMVGALPAAVSAMLGRLTPARPLVNTVCTNVPGPREACQLLGRRVLDVHPIVPLFMGMGLEFAVMSYGDRLSICATADAHLVPDADAVADDLRVSLAELTAAVAPREQAATAAGPHVADLMTCPVTAVRPEELVARAYRVMQQRRIRHLPVVNGEGRLLGIMSHRDVLAAEPSALGVPSEEERVRLLGWARASDVMETHVSTASPDEPAREAAARMVRHKIGCQPVVDRAGQLVGILTQEDVLRWAMDRMR